jgi:uncharacterized protein with HEPN domain
MQREILKYLFDIQEAINPINEYLGDKKDFKHYKAHKLLRRAVERELEIIGEATGRILKTDYNYALPEARRIVDLRNYVIHGYDKVDDVIIWGILNNDLPKLKSHVDDLLNRGNHP